MLAIKIHNEKGERVNNFNKTVNNISKYIKKELKHKCFKFLADNHCVEIVSGQEVAEDNDQIVTELIIRKTIIINKKDIDSKDKLDKYIGEVKHFCDQAKKIEEYTYLPINMR